MWIPNEDLQHSRCCQFVISLHKFPYHFCCKQARTSQDSLAPSISEKRQWLERSPNRLN